MVDDVLSQAADGVPQRVVDGAAVQHDHVERYVSPEEGDLVAEGLVHVDTS